MWSANDITVKIYISYIQVVDMRWGVRDEMTNEHMTTALCMTELRNCQRLSMGPNFIYFGAQKYGYRCVILIVHIAILFDGICLS